MENFDYLWWQKILVAQRTTYVALLVTRTIYRSPRVTRQPFILHTPYLIYMYIYMCTYICAYVCVCALSFKKK